MPAADPPRRTLLGATVTPAAAIHDAGLAGGFTMLTAWTVLGTFTAALTGLAGGVFLGATLHLVPRFPVPGDSRFGRVTIRVCSGAIGGAGVVGFLRWLFDWAGRPAGSIAEGVLLGALAGGFWYLVWGLAETRRSTPR